MREIVRETVAELLWLPSNATWGDIWRTATTLGPDMHANIRAYVSEQLDCVPSF